MGFSFGLFFLLVNSVVLYSRADLRWTGRLALLVALLIGAAFSAMVECGVANTLVLLALTVAIAGESHFAHIAGSWGRTFAQVMTLLFMPACAVWLIRRVYLLAIGGQHNQSTRILRGIVLCLPALILAFFFGALLSSANGVVGLWTGHFFERLTDELANLLDFGRILFWILMAAVILPFLRPAQIPLSFWSWIPRIGPWAPMTTAPRAIFSSALTLIVLNLLFLVANVADALFLWSGAPLPTGVSYHDYVHNGVNTLIFTVILTAIVLTFIFQQEADVARSRLLKGLALAWVAQNLLLLVNCALRLRNYIVDYELTIARESCLIFLLLVATGFVLLTVKIVRAKSLPWLVGGCLLATFATFYVTQFLDLYGWSANYNVARAEQRGWNGFDANKLYEAGPAGWPALRRAHQEERRIAFLTRNPSDEDASDEVTRANFDAKNWREFSLRAWWNRSALEDKK